MTALDDLTAYMTTTLAGKFGDPVLSQVLGVEITQQAGRIRSKYRMVNPDEDWAEHPPDLREAVCRRVARNLALRKIPLGIAESDVVALRVAGRDTEITRLEGPYRRMSVG